MDTAANFRLTDKAERPVKLPERPAGVGFGVLSSMRDFPIESGGRNFHTASIA